MNSWAKAMSSLSTGTFRALPSVGVWFRTMAVLATICLATAEPAAAQPARTPAATPAATAKPAPPKSAEDLAKAEKERLANLKKALAEAASYWTELIKRYPESPRCEQAFYNLGVIYCECEQWKEAGEILAKFLKGYPDSLLAGNAHVRSVNIALERNLDLKLAGLLAEQAIAWAKSPPEVSVSASGPSSQPPWAMPARPVGTSAKTTAQECFFRAAVVAYLSGQTERAAGLIAAAGPVGPPEEFTERFDVERIGFHYLREAIRSSKVLTDRKALDAARTDKERLAIQLGDLYLETIRPAEAEQMLLRVAEGEPALGSVAPEVRAYAILQLAVALDRQREKRPQALDWLRKSVASGEKNGTYWGGCTLFRLAVFTYNQTQDAKGSLPLYEEMIRRYPDHPLAERAFAYYCLNAARAGEATKAKDAAQAFLTRYPKSEWLPTIQGMLNEGHKEKGDAQ